MKATRLRRAAGREMEAGEADLSALPMMAPAPAAMADFGGAGVEAQAAQREAGELFEYAVEEPVTLARQKSAMIPIVNDTVEGEALSIYNVSVNAQRPLNGVEVHNTSPLYLMRGPATVFEGGIYAGDGRLADTRPGEKKLISYALDLACEINRENNQEPEEIVALKIMRGTLWLQRKYVDVTTYHVSNKRGRSAGADRTRPPDRLGPHRAGREAGADRGPVPLPRRGSGQAPPGFQGPRAAHGPADHRARRAWTSGHRLLLSQRVITPPCGMPCRSWRACRASWSACGASARRSSAAPRRSPQDQNRIRENMKTVARTSESYTRWERKLAQQEDEMDKIQLRIEAKLNVAEREKQRALEDFLANLNVE